MCRGSKHPETVNTVADTSDSTQEQYTHYQLQDTTLTKPHENPYKMILTTEGKSVETDIDTGASLTLVSEHTYIPRTLAKN